MADWQAVRRMVAEWIRIHWPLIAQDMQARGLNMEQLLHQVECFEACAPPQYYGDEATLYIVAWILHQRVVVINTLNSTTTVVLPDASPTRPEAQEIVVLYNGTDHYDGTTPARMPRAQHREEPDHLPAEGHRSSPAPDRGAQEGPPCRRPKRRNGNSDHDPRGSSQRKSRRNNYADKSPKHGPHRNNAADTPGNAPETAQEGRPCRRTKRHADKQYATTPHNSTGARAPAGQHQQHTRAHTTAHAQARWDPRGGSLGGGLQEGACGDSGPLREARKKRGVG
jgi:hypothetical protein